MNLIPIKEIERQQKLQDRPWGPSAPDRQT